MRLSLFRIPLAFLILSLPFAQAADLKCTAILEPKLAAFRPILHPLAPRNGAEEHRIHSEPADPTVRYTAHWYNPDIYEPGCDSAAACLPASTFSFAETRVPLDCSKRGLTVEFPALIAKSEMPVPYFTPRGARNPIPLTPHAWESKDRMVWKATSPVRWTFPGGACLNTIEDFKQGSSLTQIPGKFETFEYQWTRRVDDRLYSFFYPKVQESIPLSTEGLRVRVECDDRDLFYRNQLSVRGKVNFTVCGGSWDYDIRMEGNLKLDGFYRVKGDLSLFLDTDTSRHIRIQFPTQGLRVEVEGYHGHDRVRGPFVDLKLGPHGKSRLKVQVHCLGIPFSLGSTQALTRMIQIIEANEERSPDYPDHLRLWLSQPEKVLMEQKIGASHNRMVRSLQER